jgi:hypothetical protein
MSISLLPVALRPPARATVFACVALPVAIGGLALAATAAQLDARASPWLLLWPLGRALLVAAIASAVARPRHVVLAAAAALLAFDALNGVVDHPWELRQSLASAPFSAAARLLAVAPMLFVAAHARSGETVGARAPLLLITAGFSAVGAAWAWMISDREPGPHWLFTAVAIGAPAAGALLAVAALVAYSRDKRAQARWFSRVYEGVESTAVLREREPGDPPLPHHALPPERNTLVLCAKVSDDRATYREGTHEVPALAVPPTLKDALAPSKAALDIPARLLFGLVAALLMLGVAAGFLLQTQA